MILSDLRHFCSWIIDGVWVALLLLCPWLIYSFSNLKSTNLSYFNNYPSFLSFYPFLYALLFSCFFLMGCSNILLDFL
ncbi:hypothetical protein L873DRAFT_1277255 [Choiromyces venosus 120613-1]|uniref:Uncharacterized protein n=1 Tax=Choiromyces venosus 120613-1 TaxID=1336337 RepID=A0A3N4K241_9PEZI|nr:hypothetical protein L873DRAFT_1277255 [Choiromyces venosus 120613-1]